MASCVKNADCVKYNTGCINGKCKKGTEPGDMCTTNNSCQASSTAPALACVENACREICENPSDTCRMFPDHYQLVKYDPTKSNPWECLSAKEFAYNGKCMAKVGLDESCDSKLQGKTFPCRDGLICHDSKCIHACSTDMKCPREADSCEVTDNLYYKACIAPLKDSQPSDQNSSPAYIAILVVVPTVSIIILIVLIYFIRRRNRRKIRQLQQESMSPSPSAAPPINAPANTQSDVPPSIPLSSNFSGPQNFQAAPTQNVPVSYSSQNSYQYPAPIQQNTINNSYPIQQNTAIRPMQPNTASPIQQTMISNNDTDLENPGEELPAYSEL